MNPPGAFVIAVGDELVSGHRAEINGERLSRWLESLGCELLGRLLVPDRAAAVEHAVRSALRSGAEVVVLSGGLGPTAEDVTRQGLARGLDQDLVLDPEQLSQIEARYRDRGRSVPAGVARLAEKPVGAVWIANPIGSAPGIEVRAGRTVLYALPGVPREFNELLERTVLPSLRRDLGGRYGLRSAILHVAGLHEAEIDRRVQALPLEAGRVKLSHVAKPGDVELLLTGRGESDEEAERTLHDAITAVQGALGDHAYALGDASLASVVRDLLGRRGWRLGSAESVSGGLLAKRITDLPGASEFFLGGVVAYVDLEKRTLLGVASDVLEKFGAVSAEVALAMAVGVARRLGTEFAIATTGIAGPSGGSAEKPVGLTYVALVWPEGQLVTRHIFAGDRTKIRLWSVACALDQARRVLSGLPPLGETLEVVSSPVEG